MFRNYKILKLFTNNTKLRSDELNKKNNTTENIKKKQRKILRTKNFLLKAKEYKLKTLKANKTIRTIKAHHPSPTSIGYLIELYLVA